MESLPGQSLARIDAEPAIDISDVHTPEAALAKSTLILDNATSVTLTLTPDVHTLGGADSSRSSERTFIGMFIERQRDGMPIFIQSVAGPLQLKAYKRRERQFNNEHTALRNIEDAIHTVGGTALLIGGLTTCMPGGEKSEVRLYESTASGIYADDALRYIHNAYIGGRLSRDDMTTMLYSMHYDTLQALTNFHRVGLVHGHPHFTNFNVDITTGNVRLFDYTLARPIGRHDGHLWHILGNRYKHAAAREKEAVEAYWQQRFKSLELPIEHAPVSNTERATVFAKLEREITLLALYRATQTYPSDGEIDRCIKLQHDLICDAPTVTYPKAA